jgi:hypothetical protein
VLRPLIRWLPRDKPSYWGEEPPAEGSELMERCRLAKYGCPPSLLQSSNLVLRADGALTVPGEQERELLLGYRKDHTLAAVKSGLLKSNASGCYAVRASLVGSSMSCWLVGWLLGHLAVAWRHLGNAASFADLRAVAAGGTRQLASDCGLREGLTVEQRLVGWLASHADQKGTDVRITTGELMKASRVKRQHIAAHWWRWRVTLSFSWKVKGQHINELESRAALSEMKRRTRHTKSLYQCYLHLVDSQVCLGVLSKKRSSSYQLQRVIRRMDAIELSAMLCPIYAFCRSSHNPADAPSRRNYGRLHTKW